MDSYRGLLTFISQRIYGFQDILYASVTPGRILHVKCRLPQKSLDVINVYQHTENATAQIKAPMQARATLWKTLDGLLDTLAFRNLLVLGGDFNCPLRGHGPPPACPPTDQQEFEGLTQNTHDSGPTFIGSQGNSTIDFLSERYRWTP